MLGQHAADRFDEAGCSTSLVFTGQTAYCNVAPAARTTQTITVSGSGRAPSFGSDPLVTLKLAAPSMLASGPLSVRRARRRARRR